MPVSIKRKLHSKGLRTCIGKAGRCLALLMCGLICLFSGKWNACAEGFYKPVDAVIPFVCHAGKGVESEFRIQIRSESVDAPLPNEDTIHVDQEGKGSFRIELTEPGTFDYLVYEIKGTDDTIIYDETRYDVHVYVTCGDDDRLEYMVAVNYADTDEKPAEVEFKNDVKNERRTTEETTTEKTTEKPPTNVKTGDDTSLTLLITLCATSAAGILALLGLIMLRKKNDNNENPADTPADDPKEGDSSDR